MFGLLGIVLMIFGIAILAIVAMGNFIITPFGTILVFILIFG
jgi:hypothetical protein